MGRKKANPVEGEHAGALAPGWAGGEQIADDSFWSGLELASPKQVCSAFGAALALGVAAAAARRPSEISP